MHLQILSSQRRTRFYLARFERQYRATGQLEMLKRSALGRRLRKRQYIDEVGHQVPEVDYVQCCLRELGVVELCCSFGV